MLAWCGVSGETGRSFGQHGVPTGSGGAHAYRRSGTDRRRLCLPAGQPPIHTSRSTRQWLRQHDVTLLDWPLKLPDVNPIENLWHELKTAANRREPRTAAELWNALQEAWQQIPAARVRNLTESVP